MDIGPDRIKAQHCKQIAADVTEQLKSHFGDAMIATGIYTSPSLAKDEVDSDIRIHCVLEGSAPSQSLAWFNGDCKVAVALTNVNGIMRKAAEVKYDWSLTHTAYVHVQPVFDPTNLFVHVKKTAISQPEIRFRQAMRDLINEELVDLAMNVQNCSRLENYAALPYFACQMAMHGACLIGLGNRFLYLSTTRIFSDSLDLDHRPSGYAELCRLVMDGELAENSIVYERCEQFWAGVNTWAKEEGIRLRGELKDLIDTLKL